MKTAPYELTPEDHLSPDGLQERVTDPKKAAHMGHAAHLAFRHADAETRARDMLKTWHEKGESYTDTANAILESATERAGKRMVDAGNIDDLDYSRHHYGVPKMNSDNFVPRMYEGIDQDMAVADQALQIAHEADESEKSVQELSPSSYVKKRDEYMDEYAQEAGEKYDRVMGSLSRRYKDVDLK
jgi:hypothetical protein